ncbi:reprolysin-like metallopeptidase [Jiulongibacter sp. NS-SX5]|uniref:reprolysin-like metallopeptidase n=1 Tax=Jiulongibacter sp. NS-SX5 TaxID=3463854 RepID=UPI0040598099
MKRIFLFILSSILFNYTVWGQLNELSERKEITVNEGSLKSSLSSTVVAYSDQSRPDIRSVGTALSFVNSNGEQALYRVIETPVLSKEYSKEHPEFKSYSGQSENGDATIKLSITPNGITAVIIEDGVFYYIEKFDDKKYYLFDKRGVKGDFECGFNEKHDSHDERGGRVKAIQNSSGSSLRNYRIAIACTGEFTQQNGGTIAGANAKINDFLTLINARYELELSTTFTLAAGNDNIIFTNAGSDPFNPTGGSSATQSQNVFSNTLNDPSYMPYANYDIGHTFHYHDAGLSGGSISASGQAGPTPCIDSQKSRAWTQYSEGTAGGASAAFVTGIIIHEMGHQFSAWHTFNGSGNNCAPGTGQFDATAAYEPGSGNTIMSYNGICGSEYNLTGGKVDYFHARSLYQITTSMNGSAGACITPVASSNNVPTANARPDFTIPKSTPFMLNGSGTDPDPSASLTYTWDQYDQPVTNDQGALGTINGVGGYNAINSTTAPLFRTLQNNTGERVFPSLEYILNNENSPPNNEGEALSAVAREIDFRLVVRDNQSGGGAYNTDDVKITVADSGPFEITSQNGSTLWFPGETKTITWSVNNTDQAPVNCSNVNILISYDNGANFTSLVANTPNDGSQSITVPATASSQVRIKIESVGNIFFDINNSNITISDGSCSAEESTLAETNNLTETEGSSSLAFSLGVNGEVINSLNGTIDASDPQTNLTVVNQTSGNSCGYFGNSPEYEILSFVAGSSANYTFTSSGSLSSIHMTLYADSYDNTNPCGNWLLSSGTYDGAFVYSNSSLSYSLTAGQKYFLKVNGFNSGSFGTFNISISGGTVYSEIPSPSSSFAITFLVANMSSNSIQAFQGSPNLTTFPPGSYRVYNYSYPGGSDLSSYIGTSFTDFQTGLSNSSICGQLSNNYKPITIQSNTPCQNQLTLSSTSDDISSGTQTFQTSNSNAPGLIEATNEITGGDVTYDAGMKVELNPGFLAENTVFRAQIGGCN